MKSYKKIFLSAIFAILFYSFNTFSQQNCSTAVISQRIDSICRANDVKSCMVIPDIVMSGSKTNNFRFDDCFFIVNGKYFYDLTKLKYFYIDKNFRPILRPGERVLVIYFQVP